MSIVFRHSRGPRASGNRIRSGIRDSRYMPVVDHEGIFHMPDDTPANVLADLAQWGHTRVTPGPVEHTADVVEPVVEVAHDIPDWPVCLSRLKGVGASTVAYIAEKFPRSVDVLEYDDRNGPPGKISPRAWNKIKDYIQSK